MARHWSSKSAAPMATRRLVLLCGVLWTSAAQSSGGSCKTFGCSNYNADNPCQCNNHCQKNNDCCEDFSSTCVGALCMTLGCGTHDPKNPCQCHSGCEQNQNCCEDYSTTCANGPEPRWGCGLVGALPGIDRNGSTTAEMRKMIDGIKISSTFGKVNFWNWGAAPTADQNLTEDFIFMPEQWGPEPVNNKYVRVAGEANFLDEGGQICPAEMATIFLGANEPDMTGSCMGDMMGKCTGPCTAAEVNASNCPEAHSSGPPADPNSAGHCNCNNDDSATSSGFWPVSGCSAYQPLPKLFEDLGCVLSVMDMWRQTAATVANKGYKYLSTPLIAGNMDWLESFVATACSSCSSPVCGCPTHVAWHFYANDCRPISLGGYKTFQTRLDRTVAMMEKYPHLQGAIINEVGMLNCNMDNLNSGCVPNDPSQMYPAESQPNHACPVTDELPNGLGTFIEELMKMVMKAKTKDGRAAVAAFSWFNENMSGGTYNLRLFDDDGKVNAVGDAYIKACRSWGSGTPPSPSPKPPPPSPSPSPPPPSPMPPCKFDEPVRCPLSGEMCAGDQCCHDFSTCPSAFNDYRGCPKPKTYDCTPQMLETETIAV